MKKRLKKKKSKDNCKKAMLYYYIFFFALILIFFFNYFALPMNLIYVMSTILSYNLNFFFKTNDIVYSCIFNYIFYFADIFS